jgi:alpha-amylase
VLYACNSTDDLQGPTAGTKALSKVIDVTHHGHRSAPENR